MTKNNDYERFKWVSDPWGIYISYYKIIKWSSDYD